MRRLYNKEENKERGKCIICGKEGVIVNEFPKRSYGKKFFEEKSEVACF